MQHIKFREIEGNSPGYLGLLGIFGLIGGLKGAAEYERLIGKKGVANRAMGSVSVAHVFIILFIIIGNIAFFAAKRGGKG